MEEKMILVKSIEVMEVPNNFIYEMHAKIGDPYISYSERENLEKELKLTREIIKGQKFINIKGQTVCIGMRKEVQDFIGLPFHVFSNLTDFNRQLQKSLDRIIKEKGELEEKLKKINSYGFLQRLKYLFTKQLN